MSRFKAKEHIADFNNLRVQYAGVILSSNSIKELLGRINIPNNCTFFSILSHSDLLSKVRHGYYRFTTDPVHYSRLQKVYNDYSDLARKYNNKDKESSPVQKAISLLKENGYIVLKEQGNILYKMQNCSYVNILFKVDIYQ